MEIRVIKENVTLTELTKFLNESEDFNKDTGKDFTTDDVYQYIRLGHLPYYMGGNKIDKSDILNNVKLYNLLEKVEE